MWQLLGSVISSFLLLRDFFGYLIPGAVFVFLIQRDLTDYATGAFGSKYAWLGTAVVVVACYVAGNVLVALGYAIYTPVNFIAKRVCKEPKAAAVEEKTCAERSKAAKDKRIAEAADLLFHRYLYPALFNERDRRATINILRIGLAMALLVGGAIAVAIGSPVVSNWIVKIGIFASGIFMLWNGYTGMNHVFEYGEATISAGKMAAHKKVPFFRWSGPEKESDKEKKPDGT
jgi:hypothetical protein